jgi:hypothetical protein
MFNHLNPNDWTKEYSIVLKITDSYELIHSPLLEVQQLLDLLNAEQLEFQQFLKQLRVLFQSHLE